jgi:hypothetical protein
MNRKVKRNLFHIWLLGTLLSFALTAARPAAAQTWTQTSAPSTNWYAVASSASGDKLAAVGNGIYTSTNSGYTWTLTSAPNNNYWQGVASSADGVNLAAAQNVGGIYTSTNSGATWTQQTNAPNLGWNGVASSTDGSKLVAIAFPGGIYTSTNSGVSWNQTSASNQEWYAVASSADGTKLVAAGGNINPPLDFNREVYLSTNSGVTWTQASLPATEWECVACSANGTRLIAGDYGGGLGIYTSTNSGVTWISNSVSFPYSLSWSSVAMSADGSKMVAGNWADGNFAQLSSIYTSTNSGATWQTNNAPNKTWNSVASSADGGKLVAVVGYGGGICTSQATPSPQLNLAPTPTNLTLAWTIPSTNFVLQQSSDLASWSNVTNPPVLNLTNLQNQVTLSPSNSSGFFRLKTP